MKPKMIALFLFLFYLVSANQDSCRNIQDNEGCFHKFEGCPKGQIVAKQGKTTIGHADFSKNPPSFDIYETFARCINESGIFINYGSNISTEYHNCNGTTEDHFRRDFYCDTSTNGAPGASSKPNVTHPIAKHTSKIGIIFAVAVVMAVVAVVVVVLCVRKWRREPDKHEGNNRKMQPSQVVVEPDQAA